jgi:hypothetical protein
MAATFNNLGGKAHIVTNVPATRPPRDYRISGPVRHSQKYVKQTEGGTGYSLVILKKHPLHERTFQTKKGVESRFDRELLRTGVASVRTLKNIMLTGNYLLCDNPPSL